MSKFSNLTHYLAVGAAAVYGFLVSPAGQAVAVQYPKATPIISGAITILALYFSPKKSA
jgi:hypothetical protein